MKQYKGILKNREEAARALFDSLPRQKFKEENWQIVAVSNGGLELGYYLKDRFANKLHILFSQAVFAPNNNECEIARVSESEEIVINEDLVASFDIKYDYIYGEAHRKHEEKILTAIYKYRKGRAFPSMEDQVVILVDEGSETGLKLMTAIKTILAMKPKAVYIAVAVLPRDVLELLEPFADDVFFLYDIEDYVETSLYYEELEIVDDVKIEKYLGEKIEV